ncbi:LexA family transcriptional regulator [Spirosoma sordidisoli]|uniref:XRE family transcriptional regulator n=1 Tax=Spirosoma sordidisoli TaxID=2502893 RepID=A0A4Q2UN37_9BACT|nr:XRE family transcriptional regulator [Spirosoma sordidisoli]RYC70824.1 XRE family transcriptional regulator [Spirosoma sordidisoli]
MSSSADDQLKIRERIRRLIAEKADGRQQDLAAMCDIQPSALSRMLAGTDKFTRRQLLKIEKGTSARLQWLELGIEPVYHAEGAPEESEKMYEGQMLRAYLERNGIEQAELARLLNKSKTTLAGYLKSVNLNQKNKTAILNALKATEMDVFGFAKRQLPNYENGPRVRSVEVGGLRMVDIIRIPISARAGYGYDAFFADVPSEREYIPVSEDRLYPGVHEDRHVIVEVNGDSMQPVLEPGFEVMAYRMPDGMFPPLNKIVLVDFHEQLTIKRLVGVDWMGKSVTLRAENGGAELKLPMAEIRAIYHVYDYYKARL